MKTSSKLLFNERKTAAMSAFDSYELAIMKLLLLLQKKIQAVHDSDVGQI